MPKPDQNKEELMIEAICWKLYLEPDSSELETIWNDLKNDKPEILEKLCNSLTELMKRLFANRLDIQDNPTEKDKQIDWLWKFLFDLLQQPTTKIEEQEIEKYRQIVSQYLKPSLKKVIQEVLNQPKINLSPLEEANKKYPQEFEQLHSQLADNENTSSSERQISVENSESTPAEEEQTQPEIVTTSVKNQNKPERATSNEEQSTAKEENTSPVIPHAQWKYFPIPQDELNPHTEYYCKSDKSPDGLKLIGARVRGKMHKHNGTNCDDWFEFKVSGNWTIIAVSDGAGSKMFSRIGAKVSCETAVNFLAEKLYSHNVAKRETKEALAKDLERNESWEFPASDINFIQNTLHDAMQNAYDAVKQETDSRSDSLSYYQALGDKKIEIKHFSATLLLAVHTIIQVGESDYNFVMTCQIGDGMLAAISGEGTLKLLSKPDSGEHAGQTEFLTSKSKLERNNLVQKTFFFPGNLKALMVMTDGVSDDYFPSNPGILELYGDLVINQVIDLNQPSDTEIDTELKRTEKFRSIDDVKEVKNNFQDEVERILANDSKEPKTVLLRSVAKYAHELGKSVTEVVASLPLLAGGILAGEPMCQDYQDKKAEAKLQLWLDSYYQKGSFDDRTLVVMYQEGE